MGNLLHLFSQHYTALFIVLTIGVILGMAVIALVKSGSDADDNFSDVAAESYRKINEGLNHQILDFKNQLEHKEKDYNKAIADFNSEKKARRNSILALSNIIQDDREQIDQLKAVREAFNEIINEQRLKIAELKDDNLSLLEAVNIKNMALEAKISDWSQPITGNTLIAESHCCEKVVA